MVRNFITEKYIYETRRRRLTCLYNSIYCTLLLIALFSSTCYWGQGRCWIDLQQNRLFDVRQDSNATFGQGEGWWNWKITLPIGQ
jgi:hypothetical protein